VIGVAIFRTLLIDAKERASSSVRHCILRPTALTVMALTVLQDNRVANRPLNGERMLPFAKKSTPTMLNRPTIAKAVVCNKPVSRHIHLMMVNSPTLTQT
jgi:hypothetical protein